MSSGMEFVTPPAMVSTCGTCQYDVIICDSSGHG